MKKLIIISMILISATICFSQESVQDPVVVDTTRHDDAAISLIRIADSIRVADSVAKANLERELTELKSTEVKKRKELEERLRNISLQDSLRDIAIKNEIDSLKGKTTGYPIVISSDTLFTIFTKIGTISPKERADLISDRLEDLYDQFIPGIDTIAIVDYGQTVDIVFKEKSLINITEFDEIWYEQTKMELAKQYHTKIYNDLIDYKESTSFFTLLKQIGLAIFAISIQVGLVYLVNLVFRKRVDNLIESKRGIWFKAISIKELQLLDADKVTNVALFVAKALRWFINIFQLYITIPVLFSIFPPTQRLAEVLFGYILSPLETMFTSFINYMPNLFTIIVILAVTRYIIKFLGFIANEIANENLQIPGFFPEWGKPTFNIVRVLVLAFMFIVIFPYLPQSDSKVFQGVSVFLGIIFSLGSSSVIGNMVAGLVMTYMRPFKIGDRIKINDLVGDVVEKTPFVTRIKTPKKEYITVPNSNILASNVINYSTSKEKEGIVLHTTVTIGYDVPWRKVHEILINAARKTNHIMHEPSPFVLQTSLDDFYVSYQLNAYSMFPNMQPIIYSELHQNIQDEFFENGVEILSPHYRAARDGNMTTIPESYLPKNYEAPPFKIRLEKDDNLGEAKNV